MMTNQIKNLIHDRTLKPRRKVDKKVEKKEKEKNVKRKECH